MAHFSKQDIASFCENGYIILENMLTDSQISAAQDALWKHIEADRSDTSTWINAGPRAPDCPDDPALRATLFDTPLFDMCKELAGDLESEAGEAQDWNQTTHGRTSLTGPILVYPTDNNAWSLQNPHLDGYGKPIQTSEGFTIGVTVYLNDVKPKGGSFHLWPGSHKKIADHFRTHSLLSFNQHHTKVKPGPLANTLGLGDPVELTGPAGTACLWHGYMVHSGSTNCSEDIRMALISRIRWKHWDKVFFETPDDLWEYWEGILPK